MYVQNSHHGAYLASVSVVSLLTDPCGSPPSGLEPSTHMVLWLVSILVQSVFLLPPPSNYVVAPVGPLGACCLGFWGPQSTVTG